MPANYVGTPGQFTLSDSGPVTGYIYSFGSPSVGNPTPAGPDGTLTLSITPDAEFVPDLYVQAVNGSSPPSEPSLFQIETIANANIATLAWWKLNGGHSATGADSTGNHRGLILPAGHTYACPKVPAPDGYKCALVFNGHGDAQTHPALWPTV